LTPDPIVLTNTPQPVSPHPAATDATANATVRIRLVAAEHQLGELQPRNPEI